MGLACWNVECARSGLGWNTTDDARLGVPSGQPKGLITVLHRALFELILACDYHFTAR